MSTLSTPSLDDADGRHRAVTAGTDTVRIAPSDAEATGTSSETSVRVHVVTPVPVTLSTELELATAQPVTEQAAGIAVAQRQTVTVHAGAIADTCITAPNTYANTRRPSGRCVEVEAKGKGKRVVPRLISPAARSRIRSSLERKQRTSFTIKRKNMLHVRLLNLLYCVRAEWFLHFQQLTTCVAN